MAGASEPATPPGDASAIDPAHPELTRTPPQELERLLFEDPERREPDLADLATALASAHPLSLRQLQDYLVEFARARVRRLWRSETWSDRDIRSLLALLLLDPERVGSDRRFLKRVIPVLQQAVAPDTPEGLRERLLVELNRSPGFDFFSSEQVEWAWGAIQRRSDERKVAFNSLNGLSFGDLEGPIALSLYSLGSEFFEPHEAERFLREVRRWAPRRSLVVLADLPLRRSLESLGQELEIHLIETYGRPYSPWPRDPMTFLRAPDGGLVTLLRPNRQNLREEDALMGLKFIQGLPADLDHRFGKVQWSLSPTPFHNGNILATPGTTWITIHTLELRILEILGWERVPVESFATAAGVHRYLDAARQAAAELAALFGQPVRFVHPLPEGDDPASLATAMQVLGGGAGFDLDSIVTLLPTEDGHGSALVGALSAGADLIASLSEDELRALRQAYDLEPDAEDLRLPLLAAQRSPRAAGLASFLRLVAEHLQREGLAVRRLPLLLVPTQLLRNASRYRDPDFLLGWNNVVVERLPSGLQAEGFASLLPSGDSLAERTFNSLGYRLALLPPLVESVRRNGGYRCASNHIRAGQVIRFSR